MAFRPNQIFVLDESEKEAKPIGSASCFLNNEENYFFLFAYLW